MFFSLHIIPRPCLLLRCTIYSLFAYLLQSKKKHRWVCSARTQHRRIPLPEPPPAHPPSAMRASNSNKEMRNPSPATNSSARYPQTHALPPRQPVVTLTVSETSPQIHLPPTNTNKHSCLTAQHSTSIITIRYHRKNNKPAYSLVKYDNIIVIGDGPFRVTLALPKSG